jgi:hypothetical protein
MAITIYGVCALTFMMAMYGLERRHRYFVAAFALGCVASSVYGFLAGAWPFGAVEAVWAVVALRRFWLSPPVHPNGPAAGSATEDRRLPTDPDAAC